MIGTDWEKAVAERDEKIAEPRAQGESDRIDFKLQLAGVRNVEAARAILADHGGDVGALKEAEQWLFADAPAKRQGYKTGLHHLRARDARLRLRPGHPPVRGRARRTPSRHQRL